VYLIVLMPVTSSLKIGYRSTLKGKYIRFFLLGNHIIYTKIIGRCFCVIYIGGANQDYL